MSRTRETLPPVPRKLPKGTLVFFPKANQQQTAGIIINEPTSHFRKNSLEAFFVYDVFVASEKIDEIGKVMVVQSMVIEESYEA